MTRPGKWVRAEEHRRRETDLDRVQVSFWFVPLIASILAVLLAGLTMWIDALIPNVPPGPFGLFTIGSLSLKARLPEQRSELVRHARLIEMENQAGSAVLSDRERVSRRCGEILDALEYGAFGQHSSESRDLGNSMVEVENEARKCTQGEPS